MPLKVMPVGTTEKAIELAVLVLRDQYATYDYETIAEFIGCNCRTIERHMPKLLKHQVIARSGSTRTGYHYDIGPNHSLNRMNHDVAVAS